MFDAGGTSWTYYRLCLVPALCAFIRGCEPFQSGNKARECQCRMVQRTLAMSFLPSVARSLLWVPITLRHRQALVARRWSMSVMTGVRKKLREARFFLAKMVERERMAFGDHEEFDFYLSAFLSATRSVDYRLRHEQGATYKTFHAGWKTNLSTGEQQVMKFLVDDRNCEVHASGSTRDEEESRVPVGNFYRDRSGMVSAASPLGTPPTEIIKPDYYFTVGEQRVRAVDYCRTYIELLERMVEDYCQQHSTV
jgi:hypothetical protein